MRIFEALGFLSFESSDPLRILLKGFLTPLVFLPLAPVDFPAGLLVRNFETFNPLSF